MKQGDRVRVISEEHTGKAGIITDTIRMGWQNKMTPVLCMVRFDDGTEAEIEANKLEIIPWE